VRGNDQNKGKELLKKRGRERGGERDRWAKPATTTEGLYSGYTHWR